MAAPEHKRIIAFYPTGSIPKGDTIWVYGSELGARQARGDARIAVNHFGAQVGTIHGLTGSAYAIPTRNPQRQALPIAEIHWQVQAFLNFASQHPEKNFTISRVGNGMAGLHERRIARLFLGAPPNCSFSQAWQSYLQPDSVSAEPAGITVGSDIPKSTHRTRLSQPGPNSVVRNTVFQQEAQKQPATRATPKTT